ncbi:unnamed protein product [Ectocarpus sp. 8 AP-2014]
MMLARVLRRGNIWCLNAGENSGITPSAWWWFLEEIKDTHVTHAYLSKGFIPRGLKKAMRTAIRDDRVKHTRHKSASNVKVVRRCTNMWWNPILCMELQAELKAAAAAGKGRDGGGDSGDSGSGSGSGGVGGSSSSGSSSSRTSIWSSGSSSSSSGDESARVSGSGARGVAARRVSGSGARGVAARATAGAATALQPRGGGSTGKSSTATKGKGKRKAATSSTHEQPGKRAAGQKATRRPKPATEEEESKADEKAYKRSLKTMERFAARQKKDGEAFARKENHRLANQKKGKRTSEQKQVDDEAERLWERLLDVPIRFLDAPIQTRSGGDGAVTEDALIQTGGGGDVAELAASAVTKAICNAGAELAPTFTGEPARADAETVTSDARDGGVSSGARGREHQQDEEAQRQRKYMLNWTPPFRVVSGLPPNNPDFDRLFIEAREKGLILRGVGAIGVARSGEPGRQRR